MVAPTNVSALQSTSTKEFFSPTYQLRLVGEGLLVGVASGGVIALYRLALSHAERLMHVMTTAAAGHVLGVLGWFVALAILWYVVCRLVVFEPHTSGSGIPQTDAEVMGRLDMPWGRVLGAKFVEGTLCACGGLSLGREGPSVQLGAVSGKAVAWAFGRGRGEQRLLTTCGAAAGMSAAFNAPLTGILFALEEIHKEFTPTLILSVMASSVAADFLVSQILGVSPVLRLPFFIDLPHRDYLFVLLLGVVCGVLGALHNTGMFFTQEKLYARLTRYLPYTRIGIAFALAGIVVFVAPTLTCGGDEIVKLFETHITLPWRVALVLLIGKYLFTTACFASGAPGGTLFPLVVMAMLVGEVYGIGVTTILDVSDNFVVNYVVMAVAGIFSAVVQAPVTGVVLAFELTGSLDALLSVSIVSIVSYTVVKMLRVDPFYEHLLANLLGTTSQNTRSRSAAGEKVIHSHTVGTGSLLENRRIADIEWPDCVRILTVTRAGQEIVPTGNTELQALDELLFIMNADTEFEDQQWAFDMCRGSTTFVKRPRRSPFHA